MAFDNLIRFFVYLILISLAISPSFLISAVDNRNFFLIGVMGIVGPIVILVLPELRRGDNFIFLFIASLLIIPFLFNPMSIRWSTIFYSIMFCLSFLAYKRLLLKGFFSVELYLGFLKKIICAYAIVLFIQQLCVLIGLPIFNTINYDPTTPWKLNSLSAEPSHSARIIGFLMYCYISMSEIKNNSNYNFKTQFKQDKKVWYAFLWSMLTMGSGTAILFLVVIVLKISRIKSFISILLCGLVLLTILNYSESSALDRSVKVFLATITLDENAIIEADHSASLRIVPIIILAQMVSISTINGWFGHGIDYVSSFLSNLIPGVPEGFSSGGLFQLWLEYGFVVFALFMIIIIQAGFNRKDLFSLLFLFLLVFLYGVNSQIVWMCLVLLFTNKYFFNLKSEIK